MEGFRKELNFRELGGYPLQDGQHVKAGMFYRCGAVGQMNEAEEKLLATLGIQEILDFRSEQEWVACPDPIIPGAKNVRESAIMTFSGEEENISPEEMDAQMSRGELKADIIIGYMRELYRKMPFENPGYVELFRAIKENEMPILFHCSAGKDRTGVAACLILLALGASDEVILNDYLLTNTYRASQVERLKEHQTELLQRMPQYEEVYQMFEGVIEGNMRATLQAIHETYPNIDEYFLKECQVSARELESIRHAYAV